MPSLQQLNRMRREAAYSGGATIADAPWLYALRAQQGGDLPPGYGGEEGGGVGEDAGAPNPQAASVGVSGGGGGGRSGAADTGIPGEEVGDISQDDFGRLMDAIGEGAGAEGIGDIGSAEATGYTNLAGTPGVSLHLAKLLPGFLGSVATLADLGIRGSNVGLLDDQLEAAGFSRGLTGLQQAGGMLAANDYGEGSWEGNLAGSAAAQRDALAGNQDFSSISGTGGVYRSSVAGPTANLGGGQDPSSFGGDFSADLDTGGFSGSFGGFDRGRDGGSGGGSAEGGGRSGGVGDTPGERGPGGRNTYHSGGYLSEDMVPGETRGDVPATLQEGEGVLTADAMELLGGPGFVEGINMMARLMMGRANSYHSGGTVRDDDY